MRTGVLKANVVMVGELTVSFLSTTVKFSAKAAFANAATQETHGWTENTNWSPTTMQKLRELKDAMEADLARIHFVDGGLQEQGGLTLRDNAPPGNAEKEAEQGLGAHLGLDADPA